MKENTDQKNSKYQRYLGNVIIASHDNKLISVVIQEIYWVILGLGGSMNDTRCTCLLLKFSNFKIIIKTTNKIPAPRIIYNKVSSLERFVAPSNGGKESCSSFFTVVFGFLFRLTKIDCPVCFEVLGLFVDRGVSPVYFSTAPDLPTAVNLGTDFSFPHPYLQQGSAFGLWRYPKQSLQLKYTALPVFLQRRDL